MSLTSARARAALFLLIGGVAVMTPAATASTAPNILLVMTDDQGAGDLGYAGNPVLDTPHLDAFARQSTSFRRFYVSPVCTPTRASLMTGRASARTRAVDTWRGRAMMDPSEITIAEMLRDAGYTTGLFGKWHLGDCHPMRPIDQGFETVLMHRGGGLAQPSDPIGNERRYTDAILLRDGEEVRTSDLLAAHDAWFADVTSGAGHGTPPRIVIATDAEPRTVLTRNDWRPSGGGGYGVTGSWSLQVPAAATVDTRVLFRRAVDSPTVELTFGAGSRRVLRAGRVTEVSIGSLDLPEGPCELEVRVTSGGSLVAPEHVVLTRRVE